MCLGRRCVKVATRRLNINGTIDDVPEEPYYGTAIPPDEQTMFIRTTVSAIMLLMIGPSTSSAQVVEEPPIPVTMICPYHEDSLRRAYEEGLGGQSAFSDSVSRELVRSNEELSDSVGRSMTLIFILLGIMSLITLAALRVAYSLKAELREVRDERRITTMALPEPRMLESIPLPPSKPRKQATARKSRRAASRGRGASAKRRR